MAASIAHTGVMPNRPHDYIYDSTFTVSSRRDHIAQMSRSQAQQVIINPTFDNMFSALRHYPPMQYRLKTNAFPSGIGQDRRTIVEPHGVSGLNRFKYFRRPVMPYQPVFSGQVIYAKKKVEETYVPVKEAVAFSKTMGTQTMYRISETQTDPYSPDYIFKPTDSPPELLALASLSYGQGLPAGMAELEMIERARTKRVWEQSLPIVTDQASFERRLKMMEDMELQEWNDREVEIKKLQEARIEVLELVIRERERNNDALNDRKVERIWQRKMQEREALFEKINRKRIKALRKLADQRSKIDNKKEKRDIIGEYGNYASKVYAPKARDGAFRDKPSTTLQVKIEELRHYEGLVELESKLPHSIMQARIDRIHKESDNTPEARKERVLKDQLEKMNTNLVERKERQKQVKAPLKYAVRIEKPPCRPKTPSIRIPTEEEEEMEIAAYILQNVIRGRAAQQEMVKQKERRSDLIKELHTRHIMANVLKDHTSGSTAVIVQHLEPSKIRFETTIQAEYVGKTLDYLTKHLVRLREEKRLAAMVKLAARTRNMREAEESGNRVVELARLARRDVLFKEVMAVHQETVDSYLESIITDTIEDTSVLQAEKRAVAYFEEMREFREEGTQEQIVSDLVSSFLIPYVSQTVTRSAVLNSQEQFLLAAHRAVYQEISAVEALAVIPPIVAMEEVETSEGVDVVASDDVVVGEAVKEKDMNLEDLPPLPK